MNRIEIGRLLRAGSSGFVAGCNVNQLNLPSFGALVRVPLAQELEVYGLIHDMQIMDDGLVRQLATLENVDETTLGSIIADNRVNRNVPIEISVLTVGYYHAGRIVHLLPPRPPLSLDTIFLCSSSEIRQFTGSGHFGYFRHLLRQADLPLGELIAAHVLQAQEAHRQTGETGWASRATQELIVLLRDDYPTLMAVLGALGDAIPGA